MPVLLTYVHMYACTSRYMDGIFSVLRHPYTQLWSVHIFVRDGEKMKQVPCVFVVMSGRSTNDYM